jgi:hypothetical protein
MHGTGSASCRKLCAGSAKAAQALFRYCVACCNSFQDSRVCILREIAWYVLVTAMGGQATANFVQSRRINSAPILLAFVVCIDDYVNSGLLHKTICSFLRTIPLHAAVHSNNLATALASTSSGDITQRSTGRSSLLFGLSLFMGGES